jgi:hypothetical protein
VATSATIPLVVRGRFGFARTASHFFLLLSLDPSRELLIPLALPFLLFR